LKVGATANKATTAPFIALTNDRADGHNPLVNFESRWTLMTSLDKMLALIVAEPGWVGATENGKPFAP